MITYRKKIIIENLIVRAFLPKAGRKWNVYRSHEIHQNEVPEAGVACTNQYGRIFKKCSDKCAALLF